MLCVCVCVYDVCVCVCARVCLVCVVCVVRGGVVGGESGHHDLRNPGRQAGTSSPGMTWGQVACWDQLA